MSTSRTTPSSRSRNTSTHPTTSHAPTPTSTSTTPTTMFTPRSNTGPIVIMNHPPITTTRIQTQPLPPNFVYISRTPSRPILNPPSHPSQQHRSRFEPPQSNSQEEYDPYADLPNLVPSTPPTETERESVQLLRLLQLLQRIQRLEDEEREYREQVDGFRRALGEVERIVAGVERNIGGEEGEEEEEVQVVQDVLGPWRDMGNPFMRGGSSVRVLEIGADGEVRFPGMEERDGRTSRLGMSFMGAGRVPFEAVDSDGEMIGIPMHSSMFGRGMYDDHVEVEESEDGIDMDHFNTAMSALRLIYQNRRNHGHVRGHFDEDEDEDDADRDWSVEGRREVVASRNGAPLFFEDGYASVLENW
ncbi:hypothetical protein BCR33DRAFT_466317 [Rhizoclosmatium globosum]|uniref:Uncharacterized protein n=1 Tax=Rhizoclosmatium globosum TaxID=329046 RepID=A0A1Y2BSY3_9FUNG|nr:hypothetical protein BCR33DRAFT_466317 [Rhizoclosmatium globosum]|eukprot:ORY37235.1 hypothetical protein BCR33DRAFT_466317 [Rhizoclosmatium globosum]